MSLARVFGRAVGSMWPGTECTLVAPWGPGAGCGFVGFVLARRLAFLGLDAE